MKTGTADHPKTRHLAALLDRAERAGNPDYYNGIIKRLAALISSGRGVND
jgi:hypothetical protein